MVNNLRNEREVLSNPDKFDRTVMTIFSGTDSPRESGNGEGPGAQPPHATALAYEGLLKPAKDNLATRMQMLLATLERKPLWGGAMTRLDIDVDWSTFGLSETPIASKESLADSPWLVICKLNSWRFGPAVWPLPGFGCFIKQVTSEKGAAELAFVVMPTAEILNSGIALGDFSKFLESSAGTKDTTDHATIVRLHTDEVLWVPIGMLAVPVVTAELEAEAADKKTALMTHAAFAVITPLVEEWGKAASEAVWRALCFWNFEHIKKMSSGPSAALWAGRQSMVSQLFKATVPGT